MDSTGSDAQFRQAAFDHVNRLAGVRDGILDSADLAGGFEFGGQRIPLVNPYRGIFKRPMPVGTVSKSYRLVQHGRVAELCLSALKRAGIDVSDLRCEVYPHLANG